MEWKIQLRKLEKAKQWDKAITFMQEVIRQNPDDVNVYLFMEYLLMNLLVEEDYNRSKRNFYWELAIEYFEEGCAKFSDNAEFLYYTGRMAYMSEWYFDIELEDADAMIEKAICLDPDNPVYQWDYYCFLDKSISENRKKIKKYAQMVLVEDSPVKEILHTKGSLGEYILDMMTNWSLDYVDKKAFSR